MSTLAVTKKNVRAHPLAMGSSLCQGLVFYTQFDELPPVNWAMQRQTKNNSPLFNGDPTLTGSAFGSAIKHLSSNNDSLIFWPTLGPAATGSVTAIVMVRLDSLPSDTNSVNILGSYTSSSFSGWSLNYVNDASGDGVGVRALLGNGTDASFRTNVFDTGDLQDRFAVLAFTYSLATKTATVHIDGVKVVSATTADPYSASNSPMVTGGYNDGSLYVDATYVWAAVFNRPLSDAEIHLWATTNRMFTARPLALLTSGPPELSDTLTLTETMPRRLTRHASLSDTLTFTETATQAVFLLHPRSDTLSFTETLTQNTIHKRHASDFLTLTDNTLNNGGIKNRYASDKLELKDSIPLYKGGYYITIPSIQVTVLRSSCELPNRRICTLVGHGTSITLPSPQLNDSNANANILNVFRTQTGRQVRTYRTQILRTLTWDFVITRQKALELRNFLLNEIDNPIRIFDWKGQIWYGNISANPVQFVTTTIYGPCSEGVSVTLEFKAVRLH